MFDKIHIVLDCDGEPIAAFESLSDSVALACKVCADGGSASDIIKSCPVFMTWSTVEELGGDDGEDV